MSGAAEEIRRLRQALAQVARGENRTQYALMKIARDALAINPYATEYDMHQITDSLLAARAAANLEIGAALRAAPDALGVDEVGPVNHGVRVCLKGVPAVHVTPLLEWDALASQHHVHALHACAEGGSFQCVSPVGGHVKRTLGELIAALAKWARAWRERP